MSPHARTPGECGQEPETPAAEAAEREAALDLAERSLAADERAAAAATIARSGEGAGAYSAEAATRAHEAGLSLARRAIEGVRDDWGRCRHKTGGRDLECWCAPEACHADVLLEVANA